MVPIAYSFHNQFEELGFLDHFLELCEKHKKNKRALAFAFIVYDFRNPSIRKVIADEDYWDALDTISGEYLSIFYFNEPKKKKVRTNTHSLGTGHVGRMIGFQTEYTVNETSSFLKNEFNLDHNVSTPFVFFFQTDHENIVDSFIVQLKQAKVEDSFIELKTHIENAVEAIEDVESEYFNNHEVIFNLVKTGVQNGKIIELIKTKIYQPISITNTVGGFVKLFL